MQSKALRYISLCVAVIASVYLCLLVAIHFFQERLVYLPDKDLLSTPHEIGLKFEAISFHSLDGIQLYGWFIPSGEERAVILFCHGNSGNISHRLGIMKLYNRLHLSTFIFDYRGFGYSKGTPSEEGTYKDAEAAWNFLVNERKVAANRIIIVGESLGGAVAARLASRKRPAALILESAFTSLPEVASQIYPFLPMGLLLRFKYAASDYLGNVKCPVLVVHSCDDRKVPYSQGCLLYDRAQGAKEFLEIRGDHETGPVTSADSYMKGIDAFITRYSSAN